MKTMTAMILIVAGAVSAQAGGDNEATYQPRHRSAQELAQLVGQVLPVEIKIAGDKLMLRGDDEALIQADKFLHRLDRAPRKFALEFLVVEIMPASAHAAELRELSGSFDDVKTKLDALHKRGAITTMKRHELAANERQKTALKDLRTEKVQIFANNHDARTLGTTIAVTAHGLQSQGVSLELFIQHSRGWRTGAGPGFDKVKDPIRTTSLFMDHLVDARLIASPKQAQTILGAARPDSPRLLVVVGIKAAD